MSIDFQSAAKRSMPLSVRGWCMSSRLVWMTCINSSIVAIFSNFLGGCQKVISLRPFAGEVFLRAFFCPGVSVNHWR